MLEKDLPAASRWWREREPWLLMLLVAAIFLTRFTTLPIRGEESRWGRVAVQMIEFGDWLVPRQQGKPFIDRPPLAAWTIAGIGVLRGKVDLFAIRLPSILAVMATSFLVYGYARTCLSPRGALAAGAAFATGGQVLQIGRLGENESLYTLAVASSLLLWHWGYVRRWPRLATWMAGYSLAALAMLIKGPQAPVYFVAATWAFLMLRRDWRWIFCWQHAAGILVFGLVSLSWALPFYFATGWEATIGIFTTISTKRFASQGLLEHMLEYPLETFGCLVPWSPLLPGLLRPSLRRQIGQVPPQVLFLVTALAVTYPSVWLAAGAKGRYFMPLYPCICVLIGWVVERTAGGVRGSLARKSWEFYLACCAVLIACGAAFVLAASLVPVESLAVVSQPIWFAALFSVVGLTVAIVLWLARMAMHPRATEVALYSLAGFVGLSFSGVVVNSWLREANDLTEVVADARSKIPAKTELASFGAIDHRFAYYYETFIPEHPWPTAVDDVPQDVTYFCFTRHRGDTPRVRAEGRGMFWTTTPGTLPFDWEEVASIACDRTHEEDPEIVAIIGRIKRPVIASTTPPSAHR